MGEDTPKPDDEIEVAVENFCSLTTSSHPLELDNYQRPYVWDEKKVTALLDDLIGFKEKLTDSPCQKYYMGTILRHRKVTSDGFNLYVIDGQQRLTTLAILFLVTTGKYPDFINFRFHSSVSFSAIRKAKTTIDKWHEKNGWDKEFFKNIFDKLCFTVISVKKSDLAFTFFDTQNNRGVRLNETDLLKSYHLRAIDRQDEALTEKLRAFCAKKWEAMQSLKNDSNGDGKTDFAPELFEYYLWRGRNWRGRDVRDKEENELLDHFCSKDRHGGKEIEFYPSNAKHYSGKLEFRDDKYRFTPDNDHLSAEFSESDKELLFAETGIAANDTPVNENIDAADLPFSVRQPLNPGIEFFLYTEKYSQMVDRLFGSENSKKQEPELIEMQKLYEDVLCWGSGYLQELFRLSVFLYFDRFKYDKLFLFALHLEHRIGALRLRQGSIRWQTPQKFLREELNCNLLDVITSAYEGKEVIEFLKKNNDDSIFKQKFAENNLDDQAHGVEQFYLKILKGYYRKKQDNFTHFIDQFYQNKIDEQKLVSSNG